MKLKIRILFTLVLFTFGIMTNFMFAQNVKMTSNYGSENKEIQDLIDFENIYIEQLNFESENLKKQTLSNKSRRI